MKEFEPKGQEIESREQGMTPGQALRLIRQRRGLTQKALANIIGLKGHSSISHFESGRRRLSAEKLSKVVEGLDLNPEEIEILPAALKEKTYEITSPTARFLNEFLTNETEPIELRVGVDQIVKEIIRLVEMEPTKIAPIERRVIGPKPSWQDEVDKRREELQAAGLSARVLNALARECGRKDTPDYLDPEFLSRVPDKVLLEIQGLGKTSLKEIRTFLEKRELTSVKEARVNEVFPSLLKTLTPGEILIIKCDDEGNFRVEKIS